MIILVDNGHGRETKGKCSPDGRYKEWSWAREMANLIVRTLCSRGYDARLLVPEETDIALSERVRRVNNVCELHGTKNVMVVSLHSNANSTDSKWHDGLWSGFIASVAKNASERSKTLADLIWKEAIKAGLKGNRKFKDADGHRYLVQNLAICRDTQCAATLTESAFHDTREGVELLTSSTGKEKILKAHIDGIINYINAVI